MTAETAETTGGLVTLTEVNRLRGGGRGTVATVRERCARLGIVVTRARALSGQVADHVADSDLERLLDSFDPLSDDDSSEGAGTSVLYLIALDPERRPERFKVGVTDSLSGRLGTFRTVCPEASVHRTFKVGKACEGYALTLADRLGTRVSLEVFDLTSEQLSHLEAVLSQAFAPLLE